MKHITITNWHLHQHYKNRRPPWIKLLTEIIDQYDKNGEPKKFYRLPDSAKLTFVGLLCLRSRYETKIPYPSRKWLSMQTGIKNINLQPLIETGFITVASMDASNMLAECAQPASNMLAPEDRGQRTENREQRKNYVIFGESRKLYPGRKRGTQTEFDNFTKKHADWKEVLPFLKTAIENQIEYRKQQKARGEFVPNWKNFVTWINNRCWEEEVTVDPAKRQAQELIEKFASRQPRQSRVSAGMNLCSTQK